MNNELFEKYTVKRAVLSLALPTMFGMLITVIYNMADTLFVGQTGDEFQIAAITLTTPIYLVLLSVGNVFGIGGGTYISRLLGIKDYEQIKRVSALSFYVGIISSILCGVFILVFIDQILKFIGTSQDTYQFCKDYLIILGLGAPFICLQIIFSAIIRSEGNSKLSMIGMMIGTILNIILDPIMIINFNMGVVGAALATVIGNIVSVVYFLFYFVGKNKKTVLSISFKNFCFKVNILKNILLIGIPVSVNNLLLSFSTTILNNFAAFYGDNVVAALGIANRISLIAILIFIGLAQGTQPFLGYTHSSKDYKRMNEAIKFAGVLAIVLGILFLGTTLLFSKQMVSIFIKDSPQVIEYGSYFTKAIMSSAPILGLLYLFMSTFQAVGKTFSAISLSICRQVVIFLAVIFIGNYFFKLNGIVWAQPIADIMALIIATLMYIKLYNYLSQERKEKSIN